MMLDTFSENDAKEIMELKEALRHAINLRLKSFGDVSVLIPIFQRCILTGGAISSMYHGKKPNDWDLLFIFKNDLIQFQHMFTPQKYQNINSKFLDLVNDVDNNYLSTMVEGKCITVNAVTFKNGIQAIFKTAVARKQFDFVHCMPYYDITKNVLYISPHQLWCIKNKRLQKNPDYPFEISPKRIEKYANRGWNVDEITKLD